MLPEAASFRFWIRHLRIFRKYLLFRVCCREIPYPFRQFQPVKEGMVIPVCLITANPPELKQAAVPSPRKVKFIIHKAIPVVSGKSKEYTGLAVFRFAQAASVLALHPGGSFPFFTKHVSSTESIPEACPTCLESSFW